MLKKSQNPMCLLVARGVHMPQPESGVYRRGRGAGTDRPGCDDPSGLPDHGRRHLHWPGCELGAHAPVTLADCQLGERVSLQGGAFREATFFNGAAMAGGAHVRPGTLVEEEAGGAHTVGLKQTILFPYVVLGSLINFCDCLMAGGTSRKNHSEVGSGYIHFNYTPHQDKATASLIGDVPRGVMLDQPPIFLGGQGGLVGPARVAFGAVVPAGTIIRKDILQGGLYLAGGAPAAEKRGGRQARLSSVRLPGDSADRGEQPELYRQYQRPARLVPGCPRAFYAN